MNRNVLIVILLGIIVVGGYIVFSGERLGSDPEEMKEYSAIPEAAMGPVIDQEKGYFVEEIEDGLYWVTEGAYQVMFLVTDDGVIVVDAPPSMADKVLLAIKEVTDKEITHVIYSHAHADHIAGAGLYPADATYIAQEETAVFLEKTGENYGVFIGGSLPPTPTVTFSERFTIVVGGEELVLEYKGPNHTPGNLFIYSPTRKVLMLVDVIFPGWTPFKDLAVTRDVPAFIAAHDDVLSYDFDTFIGGHLTRLGTREDVEIQKEYIMDIQANAAAALQSIDFTVIAEEVGFENLWLLFDTYLTAVSQECTRLTLDKWDGVLGAADVFTLSHCDQIVESLRID